MGGYGVYQDLRISSRIAREIRGQKSLGIPSTPSPARRAVEDRPNRIRST